MSNILVFPPPQRMSPIDEADVTIRKLVSILDSAVIDNEVDPDGHIYATEGLAHPVWIAIETDRKLLCLFACHEPDGELPEADRLAALVNDINASFVLVRFQWSDTMLVGQYWMTFDTTLAPRHFIKMLRAVSDVFADGVRKLAVELSQR